MIAQRMIVLLPALAMLAICGCTGISLPAMYGAPVANTNPAREYSAPVGGYRGGLLFHKNTVAGPVGNAKALETGKACSHSVLYLFAFGDSSIDSAKADGSLKKVASVEYEELGVLAIGYHRFCTIVRGEK